MNTLLRLSGIALSALLALPAAAAQRTFVASTGLDANNCSITAPCRSFARALTQTDANGEIIVLDSAGYGVVTITQSVSIIAPEGVYAGISVFAGQHGIVVNGAAIKVALRGLTVNGQGGDDGIRIESAGDVFIEKVTIANMGNGTVDAGIRVAASATGARVFVSDTTVRGAAGHGISIESNATVQVDRSRIEGNGGTGIFGHSPGGRLSVTDSLVSENFSVGINVFANAAGIWNLGVARSTVDGNGNAGILVGSSNHGGTYHVVVTDSVVRRNGSSGIGFNAFTGETGTALVGDNRISENGNRGIGCRGEGTSTLVAERNEVIANLRGLEQENACIFKSMGNNTVENNSGDVVGVITSATLR